MLTRLLYHLQKDAQYKPLIISVTLFAIIAVFSVVIRQGGNLWPLLACALGFALAGYAQFRSGWLIVFRGIIAVTLALVLFGIVKVSRGHVILTSAILLQMLVGTILIATFMVRAMPKSPRALFFALLSCGLLSAFALARILG